MGTRILFPFASVASLIWTLVSCAATGDPFQRAEPIPGKASFYIYRVRAMTGAAFSWDVYLDDTKVAELRHGGYFYAPSAQDLIPLL